VSRAEDVKAALDKTIEAFGRLDYAFNNAGVEQPVTPAADLTEEQWDRIVGVDLRGVFLCMKHEIPLMLTARGRRHREHLSGAGVKASRARPRTAPRSSASSASPRRRPSTTRSRTSASTPCAPASSRPR
jgi:NAD(P)-dependent dehydrogenase (short-subunit alcohol dehydrogenase family)